MKGASLSGGLEGRRLLARQGRLVSVLTLSTTEGAGPPLGPILATIF